MTPAIAARSLLKRYGDRVALGGVSVTVSPGSITGLMGPNGAGKTTFVKCCVGLLRLDGGDLKVLGLEAARDRHEVRRRTGYMPQAPALYEELSARDNALFFGRARGADRRDLPRRVGEVLDLLGLGERAHEPVHRFSGGMKQRASLACALAHDPELLLLDEPTAGVDPMLKRAFWDEFRRLRASGRTLLVSTNQIEEASRCDRILVLRNGRVLAEGTPDEILAAGGANVRLRVGTEEPRRRLEAASRDLPQWLHQHGLSHDVVEIEVKPDTLDEVLARMIEREEGRK